MLGESAGGRLSEQVLLKPKGRPGRGNSTLGASLVEPITQVVAHLRRIGGFLDSMQGSQPEGESPQLAYPRPQCCDAPPSHEQFGGANRVAALRSVMETGGFPGLQEARELGEPLVSLPLLCGLPSLLVPGVSCFSAMGSRVSRARRRRRRRRLAARTNRRLPA